MTATHDPAAIRSLAERCTADAEALRQDRRGEADTLSEAVNALLVLIGDREDATSASRQHYIETGEHLPADERDETAAPAGPLCSQCEESPAESYGMCGSCLHNARRSGWEPGDDEGGECADGCGLAVDHGGVCRDAPGGRPLSWHPLT